MEIAHQNRMIVLGENKLFWGEKKHLWWVKGVCRVQNFFSLFKPTSLMVSALKKTVKSLKYKHGSVHMFKVVIQDRKG